MAVTPLIREVSDLIIGKPPLRPLPIDATVTDALDAFRRCSGEPWLSVWSPDRSAPEKKTCVGKICVVDVICYLCEEENILRPADVLAAPVLNLLRHKAAGVVRRVEAHFSLLEALDLILDGAQNLVVPLRPAAAARRKTHGGGGAVAEFYLLTQEDLVRFFLNSISHFAPVPAHSIAALSLIRANILAVRHRDAAITVVPLLRRALAEQTSVAVLSDDGGHLVGEISPSTITAVCNESVAAAIAALCAGDLMSYIDFCPTPPEAAIRTVETKLTEKNLPGMLELLGEGQWRSTSMTSLTSSSDEELQAPLARGRVRKQRSLGSYSARMSEEAIVCHPESSLVAVMVQALAHRVSYVWVVDEDYCPVGIVTFSDVLRVFRKLLQ